MKTFRLVVNVAAILLISSGSALPEPKTWISADGRYSLQFPNQPKELNANMQGAKTVAYTDIDATPDGPVSYTLTVTVADAIQRMPPTSQVRDILKMTTDSFVRSLGVDPVLQKYIWSDFGSSGPVLNHRVKYMINSVKFETQGFFMMDDFNMVRVAVSYLVTLPQKHKVSATKFLKTFIIIR